MATTRMHLVEPAVYCNHNFSLKTRSEIEVLLLAIEKVYENTTEIYESSMAVKKYLNHVKNWILKKDAEEINNDFVSESKFCLIENVPDLVFFWELQKELCNSETVHIVPSPTESKHFFFNVSH